MFLLSFGVSVRLLGCDLFIPLKYAMVILNRENNCFCGHNTFVCLCDARYRYRDSMVHTALWAL